MPVGVIMFRPDGHVAMANPASTQLLMPLTADADQSNLYQMLSTLVPDLRSRIDRFHAPSGQICDQMQLAVAGTRTVLTLGINKINPDTLMAVVEDITAAIAQERRIRDDRQRFRAIFENVRDYAIYTVDGEGRIDEWNRSLHRQGGWEPADIAGASITMFFLDEKAARSHGADLLERARENGTAEFEGWILRRDGRAFWGNTIATALPAPDGHATGYVLVTRDRTERKQIEDRLVALATTDPLTGAWNRRAGEARLLEAFRDWSRSERAFALLMVDCDHFKTVNDRWGHEAGDQVLGTLVRVSGETIRRADAVIRWGGEEFLLLLPDTGRETAIMVAERVRRAVAAATVENAGDTIAVTVSIGVAVAEAADARPDDIIRRADRALYGAKHGGRNQVVAG
jgi:diguanylate cyclase (GGDEF)-like protein/PAS domain S-box-containing protein